MYLGLWQAEKDKEGGQNQETGEEVESAKCAEYRVQEDRSDQCNDKVSCPVCSSGDGHCNALHNTRMFLLFEFCASWSSNCKYFYCLSFVQVGRLIACTYTTCE